jgi:5-methylcytosine-specific restriction protein A
METDKSIGRFLKGAQLTRNEIWKSFNPNSGEKPKGGNWDTGYKVEGDELIAFLNIDSKGRTGHDFENNYDSDAEQITWFGKPNAHSAQPIFQKIIIQKLTPHFFARWDSKNTKFTYLGVGRVIDFQDDIPIENGKKTIRLKIALSSSRETIGALGNVVNESESQPQFAKKLTMFVNRYERDPQKRLECLKHYGYGCQICGFSFEKAYGVLGADFCHVHHIEPLGEVGGESETLDPIKDLLPVCANCHEMLHRKRIALKPEDLKALVNRKYLG